MKEGLKLICRIIAFPFLVFGIIVFMLVWGDPTEEAFLEDYGDC